MKDIQKIKEFFSKPLEESLTGGYPHTKTSGENFEKITITEPIDDATKSKMIKNFKAAGWDAKPNNSGGITAIKKAMMEAKEETAIDMAKKQLDQLGAKYEMSGNKFKPFKAIYKPIGKSDDWYDKFDEIVDLFNLGSAVKSSMNEASQAKIPYLPLSKKEVEILNSEGKVTKTFAGTGFSHRVDPKTVNTYLNATEVTYTDWNTGQRVKTPVDVEYSKQVGSISITVHSGKSMNEAQEEDKVDTITMDIPLFLRMLEYSREDAQKDLDLHDVTEKANLLGKEKGILSMEDYNEIVGAAEEIDEAVNLKASKLSSAEYQKAKKLKDFKSSDWKWNADEDLYTKVVKEDLTQRIAEVLNKINEELCPAGKAYIKRRQAAGEKSSAYLSGRGVKVCKGQMSGKAKKKK